MPEAAGGSRSEGSSGKEIAMRSSMLGFVLVLAGAAHAAAADLSPYLKASVAEPATWTGVYGGLGVGARSATVDTSVTSAVDTAIGGISGDLIGGGYCVPLTPCIPGEPLDNTSFRLSVYAGYNWQIGRAVVGVEGDFGWADASRTISGMFVPGGNGTNMLANGQAENTYTVKTGWDASLRARLGWTPLPAWMVYATGGAAWLHLEQTSTCGGVAGIDFCSSPLGFAPGTVTDTTTRTGWTVGGGLEAMLSDHWIVRGEYRYADFGTWSPTDVRTCSGGFGPCLGNASANLITATSVRVRTQTSVFGLAYKF
jgi:outer membrane immunogenic protein